MAPRPPEANSTAQARSPPREAARACARRAREAKTDQDQAIEVARFRNREAGDNRNANAVGNDFGIGEAPETNEPRYMGS